VAAASALTRIRREASVSESLALPGEPTLLVTFPLLVDRPVDVPPLELPAVFFALRGISRRAEKVEYSVKKMATCSGADLSEVPSRSLRDENLAKKQNSQVHS
jgi:hypothetical protein